MSDGGEEAIGCSKREADKDSSLDPNFTAGSDWAPGCILRASGHPGAISSPRTPAFRSLRLYVPRFRHRQTCHVQIPGLRDLPVGIGGRSYLIVTTEDPGTAYHRHVHHLHARRQDDRIVNVNMTVRLKNLGGLQNLRTRLRLGLLQVRRHV